MQERLVPFSARASARGIHRWFFMKEKEQLVGVKYFLKIKDSITNRECDVYVPTDSDLELLLLLLKSATDIQYDVKEVKKMLQIRETP